VLRRIDPAVADRLDPGVFLTETRAFFAPRAATWEQRFPDDDPAYAAAVAELRLRPGQTALDVGCGTGRALPHLRAGVGPDGQVVGFDLTPEMLATARDYGRHAHGLLILADVRRLPLPNKSVDGAFAAGCCPTSPTRAVAWSSWPASSFPAVGWCCSTQAVGPPWPPATAAGYARTTCSPPTPSTGCSSGPAGGWTATTTAPIASSPSPNASLDRSRAGAAEATVRGSRSPISSGA
jgi:Methyltransferase domain